jgi:hypothetical protein
MKYNLSPFEILLNENVPSSDNWKDKFNRFFNNENFSKEILDYYYNILIKDYHSIVPLLKSGYFVDEYSGLFSFDTPATKFMHGFNLANFVRRNYIHFNKKKIQTFSMDYGVLNIQIKQCGLDLAGGCIPPLTYTGAILAVIGNECSPYAFGTYVNLPECNVIIASNIFRVESEANRNWNFLMDAHSKGMEVYFSSNTFIHLLKIIDYDRIEQLEDPTQIYDKEVYSNLEYGYSNKIYRIV